jgi:hypothetical protein
MHLKKIAMTPNEEILVYKALKLLVGIQKDLVLNGTISEMPIRAKVEKEMLIIPQEDNVIEDFWFAMSQASCFNMSLLPSKVSLKDKVDAAPVYSQSVQFILDDIFAED